MSLIKIESFDGVATFNELIGKWTEATGGQIVSTGRHGQGARGATGGGNRLLRQGLEATEEDDVIVTGAAVRHEADDFQGGFNDRPMVAFGSDNSASVHLWVYANGNGGVQVHRADSNSYLFNRDNGVILGISDANVLQQNVFQYIEVKVKLSDTTGGVEIHVDGVAVLKLGAYAPGTPALDTKNGGTKTVFDTVAWGMDNSGSVTRTLDDLYILNEQGTENNDFLGDCRVEALLPNGNGNSSQFVGSDGNSTDNYALVDEPGDPNEDTDYVESTVTGNKDTYTFQNMSGTGTVFGVQIWSRARKTDTGSRSIALVSRVSTTEDTGPDHALATTYGWWQDMREHQPDGTDWTVTTVNNAEFGQKARP